MVAVGLAQDCSYFTNSGGLEPVFPWLAIMENDSLPMFDRDRGAAEPVWANQTWMQRL